MIREIKYYFKYIFRRLFPAPKAGVKKPGIEEIPKELDPRWPALEIKENDRILVLAPHPDDEVLACGGIIQRAAGKNIPVRIVFLTCGDNNEWSFMVYRKGFVLRPKEVQKMGVIRTHEAAEAAREQGLSPEHLFFLGYPDFCTLRIFTRHWGVSPPARSMLTDVSAVPYEKAFRPGAPYKGEEILKDIKSILKGFRPTKIFLSHPADDNCDHLALYLFTKIALWELDKEMQKPELYPYLTHFSKWPLSLGVNRESPLVPPGELRKILGWKIFALDAAVTDRKLRALKKHLTQYESNREYLSSFVRTNEIFGDVPYIEMKRGGEPVNIYPEYIGSPLEHPPQLTDKEEGSYVGFDEFYIQVKGDKLILTIELSDPVKLGVTVLAYLFGYRNDRPFAEMPKLCIEAGLLKLSVYNQSIKLKNSKVKIIRKWKGFIIEVPLGALGNPQRVLASAQTAKGIVPLSTGPWRIIVFEQ